MKQNELPGQSLVMGKYYDIVTVLYYISRYLSIFLLIGLCIVSTLYAVGNLVTIQVDNFICPQYTEEEVRRFNYIDEKDSGNDNSCYYIDSRRLNFDAIYRLDIGIYTASFPDDIDVFDWAIFVFYSLIALISVISTMYHGYYLLYDSYYLIVLCCKTITDRNRSLTRTSNMNPRFKGIIEECSKNYHREKTKHKRQLQRNTGSQKMQMQLTSQSTVEKCLQFVNNWMNIYTQFISDYVYFDSKYWLFGIILGEFFEIIIQFYALLLYGGMDLFDKNENVLSQEGYIVEGMMQH